MTTDLLTPVTPAAGRLVDLGNRVWRKQVLPRSSINYRGGKLDFTPDYLRNVAAAFNAKAFDTVPFMLADHENRHTMDPRNAAGEVLSLEAEDDGLYATVRLSESAESIVRENPAFGVSVRIKEDYERSDGRRYPAACQHVLGTFDGVVAGMKPWQSVDLSHEPGAAVIDLSGLTYAEEAPTMTAPAVTNDQVLDALRDLLGDSIAPPVNDHMSDPDPAADTDELTDEQFDAWAADVLAGLADDDDEAGDDDGAGAGDHTDDPYTDLDDPDDYGHTPDHSREVAASQRADHTDAVDLALAESAYHSERMDALELSNRELRAERDAHRYEAERDKLARDHGIPPHVIDLARPLLEGTGRTVSLSNGDDVDAGHVIRQVLAEFGKVARLLDLSNPTAAGRLAVDDGEAERAQAVKSRAGEVVSAFGLS